MTQERYGVSLMLVCTVVLVGLYAILNQVGPQPHGLCTKAGEEVSSYLGQTLVCTERENRVLTYQVKGVPPQVRPQSTGHPVPAFLLGCFEDPFGSSQVIKARYEESDIYYREQGYKVIPCPRHEESSS